MRKTILSIISIAALLALPFNINSQTQSHEPQNMATSKPLKIDSTATGPVYEIETNLGNIKVLLYDDTPGHRDNFVKLADNHEYDGVIFHRVIKDFMAQTGDMNSKNPNNTIPLGAGDTGYTLPAEIKYPRHFHKYGALAAARTGDEVNPNKESSGSQFYIVTGNVYPGAVLERMEISKLNKRRQQYFKTLVNENRSLIEKMQQEGDTAALADLETNLIARTEEAIVPHPIPQEVIDTYSTVGGSPHLDGEYTVFGEVISGMETVEAIQQSPVNGADVPLTPIKILSVKRIK
ncbi:MAG: peptidylprolyl isomerase [Prevotella sp.]|nr:peptidylprolyl isomerase [Prevotella sp.]MCM1074312.1 peptidylprolyl isomerase [Ruminococcus sp.]